jgi:hypothetical protein
LIRRLLSGHNAAGGNFCVDGSELRGVAMDGTARFILVTTMTAVMVLVVTLVATFLNLGPAPDFLIQWAKAYIVSWPIAAVTGFLVMPMARRFTTRIMTLIDGAA